MIDARRGVLYPARSPELHRLPPTPVAADLVAWFWIPIWDVEPGRSSRQHIVGYPALNLVVQQRGVELSGPSTRATHRDLTGRGWAVGALLRPAAALVDEPAGLRDGAMDLDAPDLLDEVVRAMTVGKERAVEVFSTWLAERVGPPSPSALQANEMVELLLSDAGITRPEHAAARLAMSTRTLERLAHRYVGLPPAAMIRRRRLQEAAQRIRDAPTTDLAVLAAELGYADHAHLTNDFRAVLGFTPSAYRGGAAAGAASGTPLR